MTRAEQLKGRTKQFAIRIINLVKALPKTEEARVIGRQILRSGTSIASNYRGACRARSKPEFTSKMGTVVEETDETGLWLESLIDTKIVKHEKMISILRGANELSAIFTASQYTAKGLRKKNNSMTQ